MEGANVSDTVSGIGEMARFINDYGFMIIFCALILILILFFFWNYTNQLNKKSDSEREILSKEREASLEQSQKMFDLVTTVQTEQVSQLQMMTDSLKSLNTTLTLNGANIDKIQSNLFKIEDDMISLRRENSSISDILDDILKCVKDSYKNNIEILDKVKQLDHIINKSESHNT